MRLYSNLASSFKIANYTLNDQRVHLKTRKQNIHPFLWSVTQTSTTIDISLHNPSIPVVTIFFTFLPNQLLTFHPELILPSLIIDIFLQTFDYLIGTDIIIFPLVSSSHFDLFQQCLPAVCLLLSIE